MSQLQVLSSLPQVERIRFFSIREADVRGEDREALMREVPKLEMIEPVFHPVHLFRYPRYVPRVVWLRAIHGVPYVVGKWDSPAVREALRRELVDGGVEVLSLGGPGISPFLPLGRGLKPDPRAGARPVNGENARVAQVARRQPGL